MRANLRREQTRAEEIANSSSHAIGLLAAVIGTPVLVVHAVRRGDAAFIVGVGIFVATIYLLYLASALYHALRAVKAKRVFRVLDHSSIFLPSAAMAPRGTVGTIWRGGVHVRSR